MAVPRYLHRSCQAPIARMLMAAVCAAAAAGAACGCQKESGGGAKGGRPGGSQADAGGAERVASLADVMRFTGDGALAWPVVVSPDFRRVAIVRGGSSPGGGGGALEVDGQPQGPFDPIHAKTFRWSPDGGTLAASTPGVLYVGGKRYKIDADNAPPVQFSRDGKRWVATLKYDAQANKRNVLLDGRSAPLDLGSRFVFLGPQNRLAYVTRTELIVEGSPPRPHPAPGLNDLHATADGSTLLLADDSRVVVVSLPAGRTQEFAGAKEPAVSPDGSRYVFKQVRNGRTHLVIDGAPGPGFASVGQAAFAADGRTLLWTGSNEKGHALLADHKPLPPEGKGPLPDLHAVDPRVELKREPKGKLTVVAHGQTFGPYDYIVSARATNGNQVFHVAADKAVTFYAVQGADLVRVRVPAP